jgi:glycosyltransferase involved in cell wall biosynthesis
VPEAVRPPTLVVDLTALRTPGGVRGIGRYIRELAAGIARIPSAELAGIDLVGLTWVGWHGEHSFTRDFASLGEAPERAPPTGTDYYVWAYRQRLSLWRALSKLGAAAVHITDPHATPRLLGAVGVKKLVTCHDLVPTRFPDRYMSIKDGGRTIGKWIEKRRYTSADLVLAVSDATRRDVVSMLGVPPGRVVRVHNGADVERWAAAPATPIEPALRRFGLDGPFALYVGGSDYRKNVEGMVSGVQAARAQGLDLRLAWAGNLEPAHRARVETMLEEARATDAVRLLGFVSDVELSALYRGALAHLFVSRLEGFGYTVVEAMASGCPVVASRGGALDEIAGDAALKVDPEDPRAIGAALLRLAKDVELRRELVRKGRARAPLFSRIAQASGTLAAYRILLGS